MKNLKQIGDIIRIYRLELKLSQKELGTKTGLSANTIGQLERGELNIKYNNLLSVSEALNCELEIFFSKK